MRILKRNLFTEKVFEVFEEDVDHYYGGVSVDDAISFMECQDDIKHDAAVRVNPSFENFQGPYPEWMRIDSGEAVQFLNYLNSLETEGGFSVSHPESMLENRGN